MSSSRPAAPDDSEQNTRLNPLIYWIQHGGVLSDPTIKGNFLLVGDGAMRIMPDNAWMEKDDLLQRRERLGTMIDVAEGRVEMLDEVSTSWEDCM